MNGINLHMVVRSAITTINPDEQVILYQSAGQNNISKTSTARRIQNRYFLPAITIDLLRALHEFQFYAQAIISSASPVNFGKSQQCLRTGLMSVGLTVK